MNPLTRALQLASRELENAGISFAVVGGLAVSARTEPRFTRDVDLAVAVEGDRAAELFVRGLLGSGWRVLSQVEQTSTGRLATVRTLPPGSDDSTSTVVDFLFASSGIEAEVARCAEPLELFEGIVVPVATPEHLLAMKVLSMNENSRAQDRTDALALLATLTPDQLSEARASLSSLERRGFHRGKDLQVDLDRLLGG